MAGRNAADIRNLVLVGDAGSGKTTLVEQLLAQAGVVGKPGSVEKGDTVSDFEPEEKTHGHSASASVMQFDHDGRHINLIDTPGYPDFLGQSISALPAGDVAVIVVSASRGMQMVSRRMMRICSERNLPRMLVVNAIDAVKGDAQQLVDLLREQFGMACQPLNLPAQGGAAVVDVLEADQGQTDFSSAEEAHAAIVDQIVEADDALMEAYLETGEAPSGEQLVDAFRKAMAAGTLVPICFTSAREGTGVKELLAVFDRFCPSPLEANARKFVHRETGEPADVATDPSRPALAHVFKVAADPFVGKLAYFRVHQGVMRSGSQIHRNDDRKPVRIGHLLRVLGKDHSDIDEAAAGDIAAVAKVEELRMGDILHESPEAGDIVLAPLPVPRPMYSQGISPKSRGDEAKLSGAVAKLMDEDPAFVVERVAATKQTVARGLGELHLRIVLEKMKNRFGVEVETEPPKVAYKETISAKAEGHHRHKKQTGGAGQFGEVFLRIEPLPQDHETGFEFIDDTFGGSIPKQFIPAVEKGIRQAMEEGVIAGFPVTGVRVSVYDGKHHPVDSKEIAFITAGKKAFIDAFKKARPVLLEPYVSLEVTAPQDYMGDLTSDLSGKRGRVQGTDMLPGGLCAIHAVAPLAEALNYASQLKSITAGQGSFTMDYSHDEQTPPNIQAEVVAAYKPSEEED